MFLGMDLLTLIHVLISLIGIVSGLVLLWALMGGRNPPVLAAIFLLFTVLTSTTGFLFHDAHVTPGQVIGGISLVVLAVTGFALYGGRLTGVWRGAYVAGTTLALYLNVFVLVIQAFLKIPPLRALAPGNPPGGPVFMAVQGVVLLAFLIAGAMAWRKFRPLKFGGFLNTYNI